MAEMDNTTSGIVWQWLAEHKQDVLDYFASIMREASDIQLVNFDIDRHMGLLTTYIYQGVRRVDNVKPASLVEGLSKLNEDLRIRCETAAAEAERQGSYAKMQGDRVDECITGYNQLYQRVKSQGDTAEQQGANAQSIYDTVRNWYSPFKTGAESWLSDTKADWDDWNGSTRDAWDSWYDARLKQWRDWFTDGVVPDWNDFWTSVQQDWHNWTEAELARQEAELEHIDNELARMAAERVRETAEQERQRQEGIRQHNESVRKEQEEARELQADITEAKGNMAERQGNIAEGQGRYAEEQGNRCKTMADHRDKLGADGYIYTYDPENDKADADGYVKTDQYINATLDISKLTPQQQQEFMDKFVLDYATEEECRGIVTNYNA